MALIAQHEWLAFYLQASNTIVCFEWSRRSANLARPCDVKGAGKLSLGGSDFSGCGIPGPKRLWLPRDTQTRYFFSPSSPSLFLRSDPSFVKITEQQASGFGKGDNSGRSM